MSRVYFEGWYKGAYIRAEDWYQDNLVYVNVRQYYGSTAVSRPDAEKSFLLHMEDPDRLADYDSTIADCLTTIDEKRDKDGHLVPIEITLPKPFRYLTDFHERS